MSRSSNTPASNVLPFPNTMHGLRPFEPEAMDDELFKLYKELLESEPSIYDMLLAINIVINDKGWAITTAESLDCFIATVGKWEAKGE
ncbi:hypothetical protein [Enterovibrio norvegicus]|uniref:hypothetical protein n=1 Tax=Enterovibrio norvegicus TaxID=188144 RepID=UPI00352F3D5F